MKSVGKGRRWRLFYAAGYLAYVVWVIHLSINDFGRVHREYRRVEAQQQPARIKKIAGQELFDSCREEALRTTGLLPKSDEACKSPPAAVLAARQKEVAKRLEDRRKRARNKLVVFYVSFVVMFIVVPPLLVYWLALFIVRIYASVRGDNEDS